MSALKDQLNAAVKDAMRAKDKARLGTLRMATAAIKQIRAESCAMWSGARHLR